MTTCEYKEVCLAGKCKYYNPFNCDVRHKLEMAEVERMRRDASDFYPIHMTDIHLAKDLEGRRV